MDGNTVTLALYGLPLNPTVNALMRLWRFVTAAHIRVRDNAVQDVTALLRGCGRMQPHERTRRMLIELAHRLGLL